MVNPLCRRGTTNIHSLNIGGEVNVRLSEWSIIPGALFCRSNIHLSGIQYMFTCWFKWDYLREMGATAFHIHHYKWCTTALIWSFCATSEQNRRSSVIDLPRVGYFYISMLLCRDVVCITIKTTIRVSVLIFSQSMPRWNSCHIVGLFWQGFCAIFFLTLPNSKLTFEKQCEVRQ